MSQEQNKYTVVIKKWAKGKNHDGGPKETYKEIAEITCEDDNQLEGVKGYIESLKKKPNQNTGSFR